jgi:putative spermidine/putrescine transport system substrate-binding protein
MNFDDRKYSAKRRQVLAGMGAGAATFAFGSLTANAAASEVVIAVYGSEEAKHIKEVFADPFTKQTGIPIVFDTAGPNTGKIIAMIDSGQIIWDACNSNPGTAGRLGAKGQMEEIDYSIVSKDKTLAGLAQKYFTCQYLSSTLLAFNRKALGGRVPQSWADFWDTKSFPGKRALSWQSYSVLEAALMAEGVPMDKIYPIDVPRALAKVKAIKENCIFWRTAAQSVDMMRNGEASMALMWSANAHKLKLDTNGDWDYTYNQAILSTYGWLVPKGNPAGREKVMKYIAFMQDPERQVAWMKRTTNGPANPDAAKLLSPVDLASTPGAPENLKRQLRYNYDWFAQFYPVVEPQYIAAIS